MYCVNCGKQTVKVNDTMVVCDQCKAGYIINVVSESYVEIRCNFSVIEENKYEELFNRTLIEG